MKAFKEVLTKNFLRAICGEFLATMLFLLLSLGSTVNWADSKDEPQASTRVLISLCFGLSVATMVQGFSHISGAHINPAVTVAMVFTRKVNLVKTFFYLLAQCLGAVAGTAILYVVTPKTVRGHFGVTAISSDLTLIQAFIVEMMITLQLVFTVFATCDPKRGDLKGSAALAIGFSVCVGHLFAIQYTGASMNPARSLGPAFITWNWVDHWVYWVGPIVGGIIAGILYKYLCLANLDLKKYMRQAFSKDTSEKHHKEEEADCHHIIDVEKVESIEPDAFLILDTEKPELCERETFNAIDVKGDRKKDAACHCAIHMEEAEKKPERKDSSDCPQYELKLKF
ncbi:aquaporin-4-like [Megalops cyprinoides]|uniref:aquaporin-4-like n=1 Tax=Megalops cyprinoides TaxID=118141 RepID=UPI001864B434|nr:aquaporin-4-like [Megalops cyprinoides]